MVNIYLYSVGFWDLFRKKNIWWKLRWRLNEMCAHFAVQIPACACPSFLALHQQLFNVLAGFFPPSLYQNVNSRNFYIKIHNSLFVPTWRIHTVPRHFTQIQQLLQQDFTEQRYLFVLSPPFLKTADSIMEHLSFFPPSSSVLFKNPLKALFVFLALYYSADKTEGRSPPFCAEIIRWKRRENVRITVDGEDFNINSFFPSFFFSPSSAAPHSPSPSPLPSPPPLSFPPMRQKVDCLCCFPFADSPWQGWWMILPS